MVSALDIRISAEFAIKEYGEIGAIENAVDAIEKYRKRGDHKWFSVSKDILKAIHGLIDKRYTAANDN